MIMQALAPTYYGNTPAGKGPTGEEHDTPLVPVLVTDDETGGIYIALGTHDAKNFATPTVQIERRPNGWAVFLQPVGAGDTVGVVYMHDDGRTFYVDDCAPGITPDVPRMQFVDNCPAEIDR